MPKCAAELTELGAHHRAGNAFTVVNVFYSPAYI